MRAASGLLIITGAAHLASAARAYPDGAPWGAANPAADEHCASCHYDYDAVHDSAAITIDGLPDQPAAGMVYDLTIRFDERGADIAGFQAIAEAEQSDAGAFVATASDLEFIGAAIRSITPRENDDGFSWAVGWRAPISISESIVFFVAASSANDDGSPFGDTIHYRSVTLPPD